MPNNRAAPVPVPILWRSAKRSDGFFRSVGPFLLCSHSSERPDLIPPQPLPLPGFANPFAAAAAPLTASPRPSAVFAPTVCRPMWTAPPHRDKAQSADMKLSFLRKSDKINPSIPYLGGGKWPSRGVIPSGHSARRRAGLREGQWPVFVPRGSPISSKSPMLPRKAGARIFRVPGRRIFWNLFQGKRKEKQHEPECQRKRKSRLDLGDCR